ncbi:MAG: hypothetical protein KDE51_12660, partial [Anaerolineales bacterium]|nr:hypothetical protein [Anaerolineales bacterium]
MLLKRKILWLLIAIFFVACSSPKPTTDLAVASIDLPTLAAAAVVPTQTTVPDAPPPTWTPVGTVLAEYHADVASLSGRAITPQPSREPTNTPLPIPTRTPVTPTMTPSITPTPSPTITSTPQPFMLFGPNDILPVESYPRPAGDNGWGIHWMPTVSQSPADVDRFIAEVRKMHIKWVVFLNDNTNIGDNDYLVEQLVANGIMPIMRIYRDSVLPYDGELGPMVAHYRRKGVFYFQLYNEPNVNIENNQGAANPNAYAVTWAAAARDVVNNGGLPGLGALSPGGEYNHLLFLERTLRAIKFNGDEHLLNRAWISLHNYHGLRALDDTGGFLMFREYDKIVQAALGRSLPIIGTEGGSYSPDNPQVSKDLLIA